MRRRDPGAMRPEEREKSKKNAAYLEKLESGLAQVHAGHGIVILITD